MSCKISYVQVCGTTLSAYIVFVYNSSDGAHIDAFLITWGGLGKANRKFSLRIRTG